MHAGRVERSLDLTTRVLDASRDMIYAQTVLEALLISYYRSPKLGFQLNAHSEIVN